MTESVTQRPRARVDLLEQFVFFGEEKSVAMAERYFAAVDETCLLLVRQPRMGARHESSVSDLREMRRVPVKGFDNYIIFYLPLESGIDVIRVVHGARDLQNLFEGEEKLPDE